MVLTEAIELNNRGERTQRIVDSQGEEHDIICNLEYWDCECEHNFIHPLSQLNCNICGVIKETQPNSRAGEVDHFFAEGKLI